MGLGFGGLIAFIAAAWVIYDVLKNNKNMPQNHKIIWIIAAVIGNVLTAVAYYFIVKKK
ncbi:hypothetical protein HOD20_10095 [archaeon]|nr:hypothetical protein [archaeon]MBT4352861.1 hypothetical protein [archaeon]MBT4648649.1 hypothetical protein [archaeon]MBT6821827.1 hypothetical protein [archaeon]MBT7392237.1 hypothetical protein [archaeon]